MKFHTAYSLLTTLNLHFLKEQIRYKKSLFEHKKPSGKGGKP